MSATVAGRGESLSDRSKQYATPAEDREEAGGGEEEHGDLSESSFDSGTDETVQQEPHQLQSHDSMDAKV